MVRFTLKQCAYFIAVSEHGGISQAARFLNISQPSVAQALDKLETLTGLTLFDRHHARGLDLTTQGRSFLAQVRQLDEHAHRVAREASLLKSGSRGEIRLGCFHTIAQFHLARLIGEFTIRDPGIRISPSELSMDRLNEAVGDGALDMAITYETAPGLDLLEVETLADITPHIILAEDHALAGRTELHLGELADLPYVMFDGPGSRPYFESILAECGLSPDIAYSSTAIESVRSAVGNGFGFSLLALRPLHNQTYDGRNVVTIPIADDVAGIRIVLATRPGRYQAPAAHRFMQHCRNYFSEIGAEASVP